MQLYAFWLLLKVVFLGGPLGRKERRQAIAAAVLTVPTVLIPAAFGVIQGLHRVF